MTSSLRCGRLPPPRTLAPSCLRSRVRTAARCNTLGLTEADLPAVVISDVKNARKFVARDAKAEDIRDWLDQYKVPPHSHKMTL